ncbi:CRISPR-associated protein Cas5 [Thermosulfurimonas dismutans]|uniref:Putative CRISPR-associated protein n=1 Tax=Thermosulfurimonas dismutans TaxID=999894 RepID=A0A179D2Q1_9BACT|nr:CRISPR-associated protein Cas5 [Thermosulfurimonas dismutans]OAQ20071.1 putative CRISPR-associated protein [Thermosulfurimonas dismutans]
MEGLAVTLRAPVASFRRPLDINFQRTLLLPPPTTCLGLAGAALGLSEREVWSRGSPLTSLKVAVLLEPSWVTGGDPAVTRDMWKVLKIKNKKIAERSPYFRELLFFPRYTILFAGDKGLLCRLREAFFDPAYPLSLGREDELARIETVEETNFELGGPLFSGTMIPGDIREMEVRVKLASGMRIEPPTVEVLPLRFEVDKKGVRHPLRRQVFTLIPLGTELELPELESYSFRDRNFVWLNS